MSRYADLQTMLDELDDADRDLARRLFRAVSCYEQYYTDGRFYGYSTRDAVRDGKSGMLTGSESGYGSAPAYLLDRKASMYRQTTGELDPDEWLTLDHDQPLPCTPEMMAHQRGMLP